MIYPLTAKEVMWNGVEFAEGFLEAYKTWESYGFLKAKDKILMKELEEAIEQHQ